jgi:hypothetical protein
MLFGKSWGDSLCPTPAKPCKKSRTPPASHQTARPTQRWARPPLGQMGLSLLRWEALALIAAPAWAARPLELVLFSTTRTTTLESARVNRGKTLTTFKGALAAKISSPA